MTIHFLIEQQDDREHIIYRLGHLYVNCHMVQAEYGWMTTIFMGPNLIKCKDQYVVDGNPFYTDHFVQEGKPDLDALYLACTMMTLNERP